MTDRERAAIEAQLQSETPPRGGDGATYTCPACDAEERVRAAMRRHLETCPAYRAFLAGCVRRADLLPAGAS